MLFPGYAMFDSSTILDAIVAHGPVVRVVVADIAGSVPREVGASMLVWPGGQSGTIGGGTLEHEATKAALRMLENGAASQASRHPLGPALGQCCGGAVTLVSERFDEASLPSEDSSHFARAIDGETAMPLALKRALRIARAQGQPVESQFSQGWMIEPISPARTPLWIWGAGHVGRAMVTTIAPLPQFDITWIDTDRARFPQEIPTAVTPAFAANPADLLSYVPKDAHHLILTYSHALDLELCHRLLAHDFAFAGLIGSKTKWARFQNRLSDLGHTRDQIHRITCPIGDPSLGKHPQAIAIGVAQALIQPQIELQARKDLTA